MLVNGAVGLASWKYNRKNLVWYSYASILSWWLSPITITINDNGNVDAFVGEINTVTVSGNVIVFIVYFVRLFSKSTCFQKTMFPK